MRILVCLLAALLLSSGLALASDDHDYVVVPAPEGEEYTSADEVVVEKRLKQPWQRGEAKDFKAQRRKLRYYKNALKEAKRLRDAQIENIKFFRDEIKAIKAAIKAGTQFDPDATPAPAPIEE